MSGTGLLRTTIGPADGKRLIAASGDLDLTTVGALRLDLEAAHKEGLPALLDLSNVAFIDLFGLQLLLETTRTAAHSDWRFAIVGVSRAVWRLIQLTNSEDVLPLREEGRDLAWDAAP